MSEIPALVCALVVDSSDPRFSGFWQALLGGRIVSYPNLGVEALRAPRITFDFVMVADEKKVKNRWHLDLATDEPEALVARVLELGGAIAEDRSKTRPARHGRAPVGRAVAAFPSEVDAGSCL